MKTSLYLEQEYVMDKGGHVKQSEARLRADYTLARRS